VKIDFKLKRGADSASRPAWTSIVDGASFANQERPLHHIRTKSRRPGRELDRFTSAAKRGPQGQFSRANLHSSPSPPCVRKWRREMDTARHFACLHRTGPAIFALDFCAMAHSISLTSHQCAFVLISSPVALRSINIAWLDFQRPGLMPPGDRTLLHVHAVSLVAGAARVVLAHG